VIERILATLKLHAILSKLSDLHVLVVSNLNYC